MIIPLGNANSGRASPKLVIVAIGLMCFGACAKKETSPQDTAWKYVRLILDGHVEQAYDMLDSADKARRPYSDFQHLAEAMSLLASVSGGREVGVKDSNVSGDQARVVCEISTKLPSSEAIGAALDKAIKEGALGDVKSISASADSAPGGKLVTKEMVVWLRRQRGEWHIWPDYEGQERIEPLLVEARALCAKRRTAEAGAKLKEALRQCPRAEATRGALGALDECNKR
ncbi:MAG TPA: hypothetical protein DEB40_00400 [Elusimicrobia bacterium]|nr:hypothetical protein [Elusimicrobiota bacterium]